MNRQQRRALAKRNEVEAKYSRELEKRESVKDEVRIECYMVGVALAFHEIYGDDRDDEIVPLIGELNRQICRIHEDNVSLTSLINELKAKTGIEFVWAD